MAGFSVETSPPVVFGPFQVRNNDEPPEQNRPNAETPAVIEERKSDRSTQQTVISKLFEIYQGNAASRQSNPPKGKRTPPTAFLAAGGHVTHVLHPSHIHLCTTSLE